ncbi:UxaA family hydrolase [Microbaculum sp. FT89]|uniref:UxaA family hydrolase n=1 Tax=Microbaculum sp. FT89 TaxID=3447298 RepID=UPI003F529E6E
MNKGEFRRVLVVDAADNVGTVIDDRTDLLAHSGGPVEAGVPYGHKIALQDIGCGGAVIKYGVTIGTATKPISAGAHVHVHNVSEPDE